MMESPFKELYVFGASGHGKVVADICLSCGITPAGFVDDGQNVSNRDVLGLNVVGGRGALLERASKIDGPIAVALGIGSNRIRQDIATWCDEHGFALPTLVHPSAVIASSAILGEGTVVMAGVAVNPDSVIGRGVILNTGCVIEHDNHIGDFAHLSANAATGGTVTVGPRSHVGLNATILPNQRVGADVTVGAGAVVLSDTEDGVVLVGVPARPLKRD